MEKPPAGREVLESPLPEPYSYRTVISRHVSESLEKTLLSEPVCNDLTLKGQRKLSIGASVYTKELKVIDKHLTSLGCSGHLK